MISPAMTLAIFYLVFQVILKNGMPNFVIFLFSGLLLWNSSRPVSRRGPASS